MISNRYRLTPEQQRRLSAKANEQQLISDLSDSQYLITNRLRELAVLLKEKNCQFSNTRLRIQTNGSSALLERELKEQQESVIDLLQLAEDWLNLLGLFREKPALKLTELSAPLRGMLRTLGLEIPADSAMNTH